MHFILRQRVHDVRHAQARVGRVFGFRETGNQFLEGLERFLGSLLIAFGKILAGQEREHAKVIVEVDDAFEVQRVIDRGAGRMQPHEPVDGRQRLCGFGRPVVRVGFVELRLLRQRRTCGAPLELLEQGGRLVIGARVHLVLGFCV